MKRVKLWPLITEPLADLETQTPARARRRDICGTGGCGFCLEPLDGPAGLDGSTSAGRVRLEDERVTAANAGVAWAVHFDFPRSRSSTRSRLDAATP